MRSSTAAPWDAQSTTVKGCVAAFVTHLGSGLRHSTILSIVTSSHRRLCLTSLQSRPSLSRWRNDGEREPVCSLSQGGATAVDAGGFLDNPLGQALFNQINQFWPATSLHAKCRRLNSLRSSDSMRQLHTTAAWVFQSAHPFFCLLLPLPCNVCENYQGLRTYLPPSLGGVKRHNFFSYSLIYHYKIQ